MAKELFGEVVVRMEFATRRQVNEALATQKRLKQREGQHKLIGLIMLEMDILGTTELIVVLKEMENQEKGAKLHI